MFTVASSLATEVEIGKNVTIDAAGARLPKLVITTRGVGWATVMVRNARFENLDAGIYPGGALQISRFQIVTIEDSVFLNNRSSAQGGAIFNEGTLLVTRSRFDGNYSGTGAGGIHSTQYGSLTVLDSTFRGNGVLNPAGPGRQLGQFGAVSAENTLDIRGSLFHENESKYASAVRAGALARIYNSTFANNRTFEATEGGAFLLGAQARIANCTIVGNSGTTSGGMYVYPASNTEVVNTIIANNTGASPEIGGRIYSHGYNLIRDRTGAQVEGNVAGTDIYATDPSLAALGNYGGPTMSLLLPPESPALNAGSACVRTIGGCGDFPHVVLDTDQRGSGFARSRGGRVDIGAFELGSVVVSNAQDSGAGSLRQAISEALPGDVISFDSYFNQPRTIALASTLVVNKSMSIVGPGVDRLTLDAGNQRRHLNVDAPATLNLRGMRFTGGNPGANVSGGAILVNLGTLSASEIVIDDSTGNVGGCLYNNGTLFLARARLSGCRANHSAGLYNEAGRTATISDTRIEGNIATGPAGGIGNPGTLTLTRVSLSGNQATIGGGLNSYGTATISNATFSGNTADNGGGMYLGGTGTTTLTHATVTANTAQYNGGVGAESNAIVNLQGTLIAGNTRTVNQAPDAGGSFTSYGHNLIGSTIGTIFRPGSPSLAGNLLGVPARLAALADNGGYSLTHAPLYDSLVIDASGPGLADDARGLARPVDFSRLANAGSGNGSDIGAFELQVATPVDVVATPTAGGLIVSFTGGDDGGLAITGYRVVCGGQSATGTASPILVSGLPRGVAVTCSVTASSGALTGIPSGPSNAAAPAEPPGAPVIGTAEAGNGQVHVTFTAPASDGGSAITAYTATCGARSATGNGSPISVIGLLNGEPTTCTVAATNAVGTGPASLPSNAVTPGSAGSIAFIPRLVDPVLAMVNLETGAVVRNLTVSLGISGMAASPDGARMYLVGPGGIDVIDTQSRMRTATVRVGTSPRGAAVSPDSTRIYATNSGDGTVSVVDALSRQVVTTIPVPDQPYGIAITPDGSRAFVAHNASRTVSIIDTAILEVIATLTAGSGVIGVATSPDGRHAYVTGQTSNDLTVIDVASGSVVATVPTGARPYGVVVGRDSRRVYVTNADDGSVSVIDASTRSVIATVPVGANPGGIDVSVDGSEVYVVAGSSSAISRISTATNSVVGTINLGGIALPYALGRFVSLGGRAPAFASGAAPDGLHGVPYTHTLETSGTPAASFVLASGQLPPGLTLDGGVIRGTPTALGTSSGSIRATNGVAGAATQSFQITIRATVPGAPTITGVTRGNASVQVSFDAPGADGGSAITGYTASCGAQSQTGGESPIVVTGLTNGTPVTCSVIATNAVGNSIPSALSASVTPATVPDPPTGVDALPGDGKVQVSFLAPGSDGGSPITEYTATCGTRSQTGTGLILIVNGLTNGTAVTCTVIATNAIGNSVASAPSASVTPATIPDAPGMFEATAGNGSATVRFAPPASNGGAPVEDYTADCGGWTATGSGSPLTVTGLNNGTRYECIVTARNAAGSGPASVPSSVIPAATASADVAVVMSNGTRFVTGGAPTTYTITISNPGPAGVARVRVQNTLDPDFSDPSWTCAGQGGAVCAASGIGGPLDELIDLPLGSSVTFLLTATVAPLPETPVSNLVSVTLPAPFTDPNLQNNVATDGPDIRGLFRDGFD
ncbi:MAG: hypothetical protein KAX84_10595 [Burkholderiales bacterium]|nr:hypothetical protein [Burkholderiales bacterium]